MTTSKDSYSDLSARVRALELLVDKLMDKMGDAVVAAKTSDKALAMAQEAIAIVTSGVQNMRGGSDDMFDLPPGMDGNVQKPAKVEPDVDERSLI